LRQGCHYGRPAWTKLHRRWLAGLKFEQAVHHIVTGSLPVAGDDRLAGQRAGGERQEQ
jgi:hypothetical protein